MFIQKANVPSGDILPTGVKAGYIGLDLNPRISAQINNWIVASIHSNEIFFFALDQTELAFTAWCLDRFHSSARCYVVTNSLSP